MESATAHRRSQRHRRPQGPSTRLRSLSFRSHFFISKLFRSIFTYIHYIILNQIIYIILYSNYIITLFHCSYDNSSSISHESLMPPGSEPKGVAPGATIGRSSRFEAQMEGSELLTGADTAAEGDHIFLTYTNLT